MRATGLRGGVPGRNWTEGSVPGNLVSLAWPNLVTSTINTLGPAIDMVWIGRLGAASVAGVGVSGIIVMTMNSLVQGLFTGSAAIVSRSIGAGDNETANHAAQQSFVIGIAFSMLMAIVGLFLAHSLLTLLGVDPSVVSEGAAYMRIQLIGMLTMATVTISQSIMNASGDTKTSMKMSVSYRLIHMALSPTLVFGLGFFPQLGVRGAALSNVIAQGLGGAFGLWILFSGRTRVKVTMKNFAFDRNLIWRAVKVGVPASLTGIQRNLAELLIVRLVTPFGTLAVAAHSLMQRLDQFIQTPAGSFGTGAGILAAQNLGANKPERAMRTGWTAAMIATAISAVLSIIIWFWAEKLFGIFTGRADLISLASSFLRINIASYMVWGVVVALSMCLNGVGDTAVPMVTNLATMLIIQVGLAFVLSRYTSMGIYGVRWAVVGGIIARGLIYSIYFQRGRWLHKKV